MGDKVTVYGLKNCDSCRNTMRLLKEMCISAELIDVRDQPPDSATLANWCEQFGRAALLNKRSTTWRNLNATQQAVGDDHTAVQLLQKHPALMKRPVIVCGARRLLGFDRQQIEAAFA